MRLNTAWKRLLLAALLGSAWLLPAQTPQTAETTLLRAVMTSTNGDGGAMDLLVHVVKDSSGAILSGSLDLDLAYQFPSDEVVTGLGVSGNVAGFVTLASPVTAAAGAGRISSQIQISSSNSAGLVLLNGLLSHPAQYSVNVITASHPTGAMSGPLQLASSAVLMAVLSSSAGSGAATITVSYTGPAYAITSAEVTFQLNYLFTSPVTFSGMRVYAGQGETGAIAVAAGILPGTASASSGAGVLTVPATEIDMTNSQLVQAVQGMLTGPSNFSVDVNTVENPSAPLTGQLRVTDSMTFQIPGFAGSGAASAVALHTVRKASGEVQAATVIFDVNYRLAAGSPITAVDLDGTIAATPSSTDPSGAGNIYATVTVDDADGLAALNRIVADPAAHKIDLSATATITSPLAASTAAPSVAAVIPIVEVKTLSTFAPGELVEIYGTNLAAVTTDLSAWPGGSLPAALNGVSVTVGGQAGRLLYVSPTQVDAAFAFETPIGSESLVLTNASGSSTPLPLTVVPIAPALYNFAFENANFSMVNQGNAAAAGDTLVFYTTGMGQTTGPLSTGQSIPAGPPYFYTPTVTVTIGGANAPVIYSIAAPPYVAGLYQMAVTVPSGLAPGEQPVVATSGGKQSNTVTIITK